MCGSTSSVASLLASNLHQPAHSLATDSVAQSRKSDVDSSDVGVTVVLGVDVEDQRLELLVRGGKNRRLGVAPGVVFSANSPMSSREHRCGVRPH